MTSEMGNFLNISTPIVDFLFERKVFFASLFLDKIVTKDSSRSYFSSIIYYHDNPVPIFNFDCYLKDVFFISQPKKIGVVLIAKSSVEHLDDVFKDFLSEDEFQKWSLHKYIGFRTCFETRIKDINLDEIKKFPPGLRKISKDKGFCGEIFVDNRIQYLLDHNKFISDCVNDEEGLGESFTC